jgi:hypothetical protein
VPIPPLLFRAHPIVVTTGQPGSRENATDAVAAGTTRTALGEPGSTDERLRQDDPGDGGVTE